MWSSYLKSSIYIILDPYIWEYYFLMVRSFHILMRLLDQNLSVYYSLVAFEALLSKCWIVPCYRRHSLSLSFSSLHYESSLVIFVRIYITTSTTVNIARTSPDWLSDMTHATVQFTHGLDLLQSPLLHYVQLKTGNIVIHLSRSKEFFPRMLYTTFIIQKRSSKDWVLLSLH